MERRVEPGYRGARQRLLDVLRANGISDLAVLRAFDLTPRHLFVPSGIQHRAYDDAALPIGNGQTISQPTVHARYLAELRLTGRERVLEVGTGSGYQTALLAHLVEQVFTVEKVPSLAERARETMHKVGARNVSILVGDGTLGWREFSPYDAVLVSAGAPAVPPPLLEQLADGGRLLIPVGSRDEQSLQVLTKHGEAIDTRDIGNVRFVPLLGAHGWPS